MGLRGWRQPADGTDAAGDRPLAHGHAPRAERGALPAPADWQRLERRSGAAAVQSDRGASRRQVRDHLPVVPVGRRRARRPLPPSICGHPGDSPAARQLVDPGRRRGRNGDRRGPRRIRPDPGPARYDLQRGGRLRRPLGTGQPANSRRRARPDPQRMDARTRLRSGTRPGRSRCAPTRSTTWNRRDRAAPTTTRRCRRSCQAHRSPRQLELWPRAMEPAPQPPGGPDRRTADSA